MSKNAQAMKFVVSEKEPSKVEPMSSNEAAITSKIEPKPSKVDPMPSKLDPMPSSSSDSLSKVMKSAPIFNIFSDIPAEGDKYESSQEVQGHTSTIKEFQPVVNIYTDVHEVTDLKEHVKDNHQPENNDLLVHNLGDTHFNLLPEGVTDLCETLADVQGQIGAIKEFQPVVNIYTDVDEVTDLKEDNTPRAMNHHPHLQSNTHLNLLPKELTYLGTTSVEKNDSQDKADTAPKNVVVDQIVDKSSNGASTKGVAKEPTEASSNKTEDATVEIDIQMASVEGNKVVAEKDFSNVAMDEVMSDKAPSSAEPVVQEVPSYAVPIVPEENKKEELSSTEAMFEMSAPLMNMVDIQQPPKRVIPTTPSTEETDQSEISEDEEVAVAPKLSNMSNNLAPKKSLSDTLLCTKSPQTQQMYCKKIGEEEKALISVTTQGKPPVMQLNLVEGAGANACGKGQQDCACHSPCPIYSELVLGPKQCCKNCSSCGGGGEAGSRIPSPQLMTSTTSSSPTSSSTQTKSPCNLPLEGEFVVECFGASATEEDAFDAIKRHLGVRDDSRAAMDRQRPGVFCKVVEAPAPSGYEGGAGGKADKNKNADDEEKKTRGGETRERGKYREN